MKQKQQVREREGGEGREERESEILMYFPCVLLRTYSYCFPIVVIL